MKKINLLFLLLVALLFLVNFRWLNWREMLSLAYPETITPNDLQKQYTRKQLKILIVPGHDNFSGGAQFKNLKEAELTLALAKELSDILSRDKNFIVTLAREPVSGDYSPMIQNYFLREAEAIRNFQIAKKAEFKKLMTTQEIEPRVIIQHNFAPDDVAFRLYGLNKWANDNQIDVMLHLHFNDYAGRRGSSGKYNGLAIYIPERQYPNSRASAALAQSLLNELQKISPLSNLPKENQGVIEDQELIATGSYATQVGASMLIEYGYIYEPQFIAANLRTKIFPELALQTYQGIKKHFDADLAEQTALLPFDFKNNLQRGLQINEEVLVLQRALLAEKVYPPAGKTLNDCPLTGNFGPCVEAAVKIFQQQNNLPVTGQVRELTRAKLNERF